MLDFRNISDSEILSQMQPLPQTSCIYIYINKTNLDDSDSSILRILFCISRSVPDHKLSHRPQYKYRYERVAVVVAVDDTAFDVAVRVLSVEIPSRLQRNQFQ